MMNEASPQPTTTRRRSRSRSKGRNSLESKPIRVWCPGSYDFLHFGQINLLRKVKHEMMARFPMVEMIVGLYSNEDLIAVGQPPVFSSDERYEMLRANKWVDEIVKGASFELSKRILKENNCDYAFTLPADNKLCILPEFEELRQELLECGLLITLSSHEHSRITTAQIVNRLLLLEQRDENNNTQSGRDWAPKKLTFPFSISCKELVNFTTGSVPKKTDRIVYVDGSFDLLHPGHMRLLEKARSLGDFLYVGLHSDEDIAKYTGGRFPIMQWNERLMSLLSCKFVSEVIIDAPSVLTESLLDAFQVNCVVRGIDDFITVEETENEEMENQRAKGYNIAKQRGILHEFPSNEQSDNDTDNASFASKLLDDLRTMDILCRIHKNWAVYNNFIKANEAKSNEATYVEKLKNVNLCEKESGDAMSSGFGADQV